MGVRRLRSAKGAGVGLLSAWCVLGIGLGCLGRGPSRAEAATATGPTTARPLPTFTVIDATGAETSSTTLFGGAQSLVLYLSPAEDASASLLRVLESMPPAAITPRIVVIVGRSSAASMTALRDRHPALSGARWCADAGDSAWRALELRGMPVVLGVQAGEERWRVLGMLPNAESMKSLLQMWVSQ
jgi:hypothetical protein